MRNFLPVLEPAELLDPQQAPQDKLGGLPFGLARSMWPLCKDCGKPQTLLAQFLHDSERLNLGKAGRVLNVFQCDHDPGMCQTWQGGSGANACFVSEPEDSTGALTSPPTADTKVEREARVSEWREYEDDLSMEEASRFSSSEAFFALPRVRVELTPSFSRLGGAPHWIQSPDEAPGSPWQFVGQLDSTYSFLRPPAAPVEGIYADREQWEGRTHYCEGPNFGDGGIAYLYVNRELEPPAGWVFWQCG